MSELGDTIEWNERGLAPAVVSHVDTGAVLMLGWMNREALDRTEQSGQVHFFSRSRQALWRKGETSGNTLDLVELRIDCDADAILVVARPHGPTCHLGEASCFFRYVEDGNIDRDPGPRGAPAAIIDRVYSVLELRRGAPAGKSYTAQLLAGGVQTICDKIDEEAGELIEELRAEADPKKVVHETADLIYHVLAGLLAAEVEPKLVWAELSRRFGVSGLQEKAARK